MSSDPATEPAAGTARVLARALIRLDRSLGWVTASAAGLLVLAEVGVLGAGVIARYLLNRPLGWSDELASSLFLWLAMLGSVLALRRGEHMRMGALVDGLRPPWQRRVRLAGTLLVALMAGGLVVPALQYVQDQLPIMTPALEISDGWRSAALPVACALLAWTAALDVVRLARPRELLLASILVALVCIVLWTLRPLILQWGNLNLLLFFVGGVGLSVALGVPIAFCFGGATLAYLVLASHAPLTIIVSRIDEGTSSLLLLSVPLFVLLGALIEMTGLSRALVRFLGDLIGHVRGGLSYVLLAAMYLVSGISGSKAADMAAVAPALLPQMRERGAAPGELVALLAASGAMSETIAPSLVLITIGSVCGVSIAALFSAGLLPALVCAAGLAAMVRWRARDEPTRAPVRAAARTLLVSGTRAVPALLLPVLIRWAVVHGVATATEVSTIGIGYSVLAGLVIYRQFPLRRLPAALIETAALSGAILLIIGTATAMAWALTQSGFSRQLADLMAHVPGGPTGFLLVSALGFALLGSVLEGIPAIVLFGPLLFPVARQLGIPDVHYAMTVVIAMGIGLFAPPLGVGFYAACAIGRSAPELAMRAIWSYLGALAAALLAIVFLPWISTCLS